MKTIIKPGVPEVAQYECDVTGLPLSPGPAATLTIKCGYGSACGGGIFDLDLSEEAAVVVVPLLRALLLDGAPLRPHRSDASLNEIPSVERRIGRRECTGLLHRLRKLSHYKRKVLATVKRALGESSAGRTVSRGVFSKPVSQAMPASAQKTKKHRQNIIVRSKGMPESGAASGRVAPGRPHGIGGKRRRNRVLLPGYEELMHGPKSNDLQAALDAVRGDR